MEADAGGDIGTIGEALTGTGEDSIGLGLGPNFPSLDLGCDGVDSAFMGVVSSDFF